MKELICITCPRGCHLKVDEENGYAVTGNHCEKGEAYGKAELIHPVRVVTSTVRSDSKLHPRIPCKTSKPIPKEMIEEVMDAINGVRGKIPVQIGNVLISNVAGTGADIIATKEILE